jgi:hypothetical protein
MDCLSQKSQTMKKMILPIAGLLFSLVGCQGGGNSVQWAGPDAPQPVRMEPWQFGPTPGQTVVTPHYLIHTTIMDDADFLHRLAQTMEGAYLQYQELAGGPKQNDRPMECWVFSNRTQWVTFTIQHTGPNAKIYLQINRGGYTVYDWFVSYFTGDVGTFAVAAHEGWHQYVARHFKTRLPPFLEEGIATQFENIHWEHDLPRWNLTINANRALQLREAFDGKTLWPLAQLVTMHAGNVVGTDRAKIDAFYAQDWAFVRFWWEADDGKYRPAFQKLLADAAAGHVDDPTGITQHLPIYAWRPETAKPILERYFGMPLDRIEKEYLAYVHKIAYDRFNQQWQAGGVLSR